MGARSFLLLLLLLVWQAPGARPAIEIPLYTYYQDPPFAVDYSHSITVAMAQWLTRHSSGQYRFVPRNLPRKRLDQLIATPNWRGVVAWANPHWFDDLSRTRYVWSIPFARDADLVVSRKDHPVNFIDSNSLNGLTLGGILGRRYDDFDSQLRAGLIRREDATSVDQNLMKLRYGRIDVTFMQGSSLPYYRRRYPDLEQWLYVSPKPRRLVERYMFTASSNKALMLYLNRELPNFIHSPSLAGFFQDT